MSQPRPIHPIPSLLIFTSVLLLLLLPLLPVCITLIASNHNHAPQGIASTTAAASDLGTIRRFRLLSVSETQQAVGNDDEVEDEDENAIHAKVRAPKKKPGSSFPKNQTRSDVVKLKPSLAFSSKNRNNKAFTPPKNSTKPIEPKLGGVGVKNSSKLAKASGGSGSDVVTKVELKKLNSTATNAVKKLNLTAKGADSEKPGKDLGKKSVDLAVNKPTLEEAAKKVVKESKSLESAKISERPKAEKKVDPAKKKILKKETPSLDLYGGGVKERGDEDDLIVQFRDLPAEFHQTLLPDLERISAASKAYVGKANERIAKNLRPYVGRRYASAAAAAASFAFALVPLIIVSLIVRHVKEHLSVQSTAVFVHVYLAVYFSILCVSALITGVEPLRFFDATAHSTYTLLQIAQMVGYTLYLVLLFLSLVRVFSTGSSPGSKMLVLAQVVVGYVIGIHHYVVVFHRAVSHQPPKTSWKVHGVYAACFAAVCVLTWASTHRKKAYLAGEGEGDKQS